MNKIEQLKTDIEKIEKGLNSSTTPEQFKDALRKTLKEKKDELKELMDAEKKEEPAKKAAPAKAAPPKKVETPKKEAPAKKDDKKKSPKNLLDDCRDIIKKHKEQQKAASKRVEERRKQGKPATLTPSETVKKTAQSVKSKVVSMTEKTDKGLPASEVNKLSTGIIATIKSTLQGISTNVEKHRFLNDLISEIKSLNNSLTKVAMQGAILDDGGEMDEPKVVRSIFEEEEFEYADGGMMAKGGLMSVKRKYERNEDDNLHSENVVLLAKHFGTPQDLAEAKEILRVHEAEGSMSMENSRKRYELHEKLMKKARAAMEKEGISFADGGMMARGGKFQVGDKVMVNDKGYATYFDGFDLSKPATILEKGKVKTSRGTMYFYAIQTADGKKPFNRAPENILTLANEMMAMGGMIEHGLKVGDTIIEKSFIPNEVVVKTKDGKYAHIDLNKGERHESDTYAKGGGVNRGAAWTLDHYQYNKSEKYEVPPSQRKH